MMSQQPAYILGMVLIPIDGDVLKIRRLTSKLIEGPLLIAGPLFIS
ncbi:hypothetical protein H4683_001093 [Filibacter limicola]|uniref:Uncharacterized protein n=1 Tax=Sporosarcina limicola TaxID=34101 RepID=A0A927MG62_9BACL|nr:hypothetical protein [Sporosarcina limicola]